MNIPVPSNRCLLGKQALVSFLLRALILREKCRYPAHSPWIQEGPEEPETPWPGFQLLFLLLAFQLSTSPLRPSSQKQGKVPELPGSSRSEGGVQFWVLPAPYFGGFAVVISSPVWTLTLNSLSIEDTLTPLLKGHFQMKAYQ